jgi:hypothetical protein
MAEVEVFKLFNYARRVNGMKKGLVLSLVAFVVFGLTAMTSVAMADFSQTNVTAAYNLVNDNPNVNKTGTITVTVQGISAGIEYDAGSGYHAFSTLSGGGTGFTVTGVMDKKLVNFRLDKGSGVYNYIAESIYFTQPKQDSNTTNLFRNVRMTFEGGNGPSFQLTSEPNYAQPVPLPGAVWLLGTGLIGLVGVRRRRNLQI